MEYPMMEADSITSGIKRLVKDKRISKTKLNVSLASKIKTKIINNSSIFKISLKHNNRALAQALSREKENSRRITTEKMLLQKEVEKLNFENAFLRLKLNNLNKKLIEIESLMNNNLITAIEMSSLSEFHQNSFLLPASKKKRISKQCKFMRLPFARVPLTSNDDDDDDDKEKMQSDNKIISKASPDNLSSVSTGQNLSTQYNLDVSFHKENNQNVYSLDHSEDSSSTVDIFPKESHSHSDQHSKSSLVSEMRNTPSISHIKEKPSATNVNERKKHGSSWETSADTPCVTDLDQQQILSPELKWNNEINDHTNEKNITIQRNRQCLPDISSESAGKPDAECMSPFQVNDDFELQKTVYDADMDLTASDVSKIVTVSRGTKNKNNQKPNDCERKTLRKVKDSSSEKKTERAKKKCKKSSDVDVEEKVKNRPERRSVVLDGKRDSEDPNFIHNTEQLTQANILKKITLQNSFDQDDGQSTHYNKKKKGVHVTNEQQETYPFSQSSHKFLQDSKLDMCQNSLTCNKSKTSTQTFVMHKLENDNLFPDQKDKETISENLEVVNEFPRADLSSKDNQNFCDYETQNMLNLKKYVTDVELAQQNESKINKKLRPKVNRKTEIISEVNQIYEVNNKDVHVPEKDDFFSQTQVVKETFSGKLEVSKEFQIPALFMKGNGNILDCETQNILGLQKQITSVYPVQQNESKVNKKLRPKINRRTEIISEVNHFENDESVHCSEKSNPFFLQKGREIIPGNLKDSDEFQTPVKGKLCEYETQNVSGMRRHIHDMQLACQNDSKVHKKLRQKAHRKTEIMSDVNQLCEDDDKGMHDLGKDNFVSLTPKHRETVSENLQVANEFPATDFPTKDNGNLCDYEIHNVLDLENHVAHMHLVQQNELKINKKLKQKINRKTEIISEVNQVYEAHDKDMHDQKCCTEDLDLETNKSEQRLECKGIISGYYMEINSNEKENCDAIPDPYKLVNKHKKKSGKAKNFLTRDMNKSICQLTDSSLSSLKYITNEADSDPGNHLELPKNHRKSTVTLNTKRDVPFVEVIKEGKCQVKTVNKMTSKSKKRKTLVEPSPETSGIMEIIPDVDHRKLFDSKQANKENYLENQDIVKIKPDSYTNVFRPLAQIYSPNIQDSSLDNVHQSSLPLSISSSKNLIIKENFALENLSIFQVSDDVHEKMKEVNQKIGKSGIGNRTLQDLTNTSLVSNNTAKSENDSEDLSSEPRSRRRCAPVSFKEPSLRKKMRR
uniref:Shugoshin 2 n=1 Tax=Sciurus vulgaris TaxID=55149 RepID=A0A8D2ANW0_SCIVU